MLRLNRTLGRASDADPDDVLGVKRALARLRYYDSPMGEFHEFLDAELFEGVEAFQRERELEVDGVMKPGGPTEASLNEALDFRPESASAVPWRREPHGPSDGSKIATGAMDEGPLGSRLLPRRADDRALSWRTMELRPEDAGKSRLVPLSLAGNKQAASPSSPLLPNLLMADATQTKSAAATEERSSAQPPIPQRNPKPSH